MPDLIKRLIKIARASAGDVLDRYGRRNQNAYSEKGGGGDDFEPEGNNYHYREQSSSSKGQNFSHGNSPGNEEALWPSQVVEDLRTFGLKPPSTLEEVKKARNAEIRKYHSDRFLHDPDKLEISKQIMQIYNAAYERLEKWFSERRI